MLKYFTLWTSFQCVSQLHSMNAVCVCVRAHADLLGLNYLLMDGPAAVSEDVLMGNQRCAPPPCRHQSCRTSHPSLTSTFFCAPWCAAVGQAGKDDEQREGKGEKERSTQGEKGDFYYYYCFKLTDSSPPLLTAQMSCLFNTPELSLTPSSPPLPSAFSHSNLGLANPSLPPHKSSASHLLLSCFFLPSQWTHTALGGLGRGERSRKRDRERRRESGRPLAVRESAPGWAGFLDTLWGTIVLHVSSPSLLMGPVYHHSDYGRWLELGEGGVEMVDLEETYMWVRERNKECTGEGGRTKARFGYRGLKTKGPQIPHRLKS